MTIATGKKLYVDLAINLARSFFLWHPQTTISFQIVTDMPWLLPLDIVHRAEIRTVKPNELGEGFSPKLHLDKLASASQTLFIDSDCLIFSNIEHIFNLFKGKSVSVIGGYINEGEWFGDIGKVCLQFNIPHLPKFNGGLYYLEKGTTATKVYQTARMLENRYDEIGFIRLRNRPNDEVLMALAMQLHQQNPVTDDGTIMSDPQACPGRYNINIIKGIRQLINPPKNHHLHQSWYPFHQVSPAIVHFLGYYTQHYPYKREVYRLHKHLNHDLSLLTEVIAFLKIESPIRLKAFLKNKLRPFYRAAFGIRKVSSSERI